MFPALATAGSFGCSVAGLTRCPPLQSRSAGRLPLLHSENSGLAVGAASACFAVAEARAPEIPSPRSPARVIDRRDPVRTLSIQKYVINVSYGEKTKVLRDGAEAISATIHLHRSSEKRNSEFPNCVSMLLVLAKKGFHFCASGMQRSHCNFLCVCVSLCPPEDC